MMIYINEGNFRLALCSNMSFLLIFFYSELIYKFGSDFWNIQYNPKAVILLVTVIKMLNGVFLSGISNMHGPYILDGILEISADVFSKLHNLICLRLLFRSIVAANYSQEIPDLLITCAACFGPPSDIFKFYGVISVCDTN